MKRLKFKEPYKITSTQLSVEYLNEPLQNYQRLSAVATKYGVVMVSELKWQDDFGWSICAIFSTTKDGLYYSATIEKAQLNEMQLKWISTSFIKKVLNGSWKKFTYLPKSK